MQRPTAEVKRGKIKVCKNFVKKTVEPIKYIVDKDCELMTPMKTKMI